MTRHTATQRIVPPLVVLSIIGCVWYATSSQPKPSVALPGPQQVAADPDPGTHTSAGSNTANQQPIADIAPTIAKLGNQVQFSVDTAHFKQVQKVEFYVETKLVGAAFSQPYTVSVNEDNLTAGTHSVTAKVYTNVSTAQTIPALFTATPTKPAKPVVGDEDNDTAQLPPAPAATAAALAAPGAPSVTATPSGNGAQLSWDATAAATAYQVWRDNALVSTVSGTAYTDNGLNQGQTYDYYLIAVGADGGTSAASGQTAVTMPGAPAPPATDPAGPTNPQPPQDDGGSDTPAPGSANPSTGDAPGNGSGVVSDPSLG